MRRKGKGGFNMKVLGTIRVYKRNFCLENKKMDRIDKIENGKIKLFNQLEGWGFITDKNGHDVFFHKNYIDQNGFKKTPTLGDEVIFIREIGNKGPRAFQWSFKEENQEKKLYRVLYKRYGEEHTIIFSTGTVDQIKYPKNFEKIRFQQKIGLEWLECSDPHSKETESA